MFMKIKIFYFTVTLLILSACQNGAKPFSATLDLKQILKKGKLTVLTENSSMSFFEYREKKLGFEYEILDSFARTLNVKLEIKVVENSADFPRLLANGEGDIVAQNLAITLSNKKLMNFSEPYYYTHQVIVQRKLADSLLIKDATALGGKKVYVRKRSSFDIRLAHLSDEIGVKINTKYPSNPTSNEDLIEMVSSGKIDYTIANENLARISNELHPNLFISTIVSSKQKIGFGLRPNSVDLTKKLNTFLLSYCKSDSYKNLKKRYFDYITESPIETTYSKGKGDISPFDAYFKKAAEKFGWDWRILAAVAFKESRFNPNARGLGGAFGLMQFMPSIGAHYGVNPSSSPELQIKAAMNLLDRVYVSWSSIPDVEQRLKFTLASYNAGKGHVDDAQRLAVKYGLNPKIWDGNVQTMVKKLSDPVYYRDEVVRCGAYRGPASSYASSVYNQYMAWK